MISEVLPFLLNPLSFLGYALLFMLAVGRTLRKPVVIAGLPQSGGSRVVNAFLRYGLRLALASIVSGMILVAVDTVPGFRKSGRIEVSIDTYEAAAEFVDRVYANSGKIVFLSASIEAPLWGEGDCDFVIWRRHPEEGEPSPTRGSAGTQFCLLGTRASGEVGIDHAASNVTYVFRKTRGILNIEGYFSIEPNVDVHRFGDSSIGLQPVGPNFGRDKSQRQF